MATTIRDLRWHAPEWAIGRSIHALWDRIPVARSRPRRISLNLWIGSGIIALVLLAALLTPVFTSYAFDTVMAGAKLDAPSFAHPFGTDQLGRDMLSRVLNGARIAIGIAALGVGIAGTLGIFPGLLAGYRGGWLDQALSRLMEVWLAFPGTLLALVIVSRLGPSLQNSVIALGIVGAPAFYRLTRSATLSARRMPYVEAAESIGASEWRILLRHILPNLASPLVVLGTMRSGTLLLACGGLSFVGLGAQPPLPEWGALLAAGRNYMDTAPWLAIFPGLSIMLAVVGLNLLGDGLRDWLDPRQGD